MPQRVKNRNYPELTYLPSKRQADRWRKKYRGKTYYFARNDDESIEASYRRCLRLWKVKKAELDGTAELMKLQDSRDLLMEIVESSTNEMEQIEKTVGDTRAGRIMWLAYAQRKAKALAAIDDEMIVEDSTYSVDVQDRQSLELSAIDETLPNVGKLPPWKLAKLNEPVAESIEDTLKANVEAFLGRQLIRHNKGELSAKRYDALKRALADALLVLGKNTSIATVDGAALERYRDSLEERIGNGLSNSTARDRLQALKQFVRWAYQREAIDRLPRNIDSKDMNIESSKPNPERFTDEELKALFDVDPSDRTRLYLLLMLNTGATSKDLADLRKSEYDVKAGTITRQRSKTRKKHSKSVPTVTWKLWPETVRLLEQERNRNRKESLLLTNENGAPIMVNQIVDGDLKTTDNVKSAYKRLREKADRRGVGKVKALKVFRSTSGSKLANHPEYQQFRHLFLGHSERSVADKFYVVPDQGKFDEAVTWLGSQWSKISGVK